jgi:hypothetical protein
VEGKVRCHSGENKSVEDAELRGGVGSGFCVRPLLEAMEYLDYLFASRVQHAVPRSRVPFAQFVNTGSHLVDKLPVRRSLATLYSFQSIPKVPLDGGWPGLLMRLVCAIYGEGASSLRFFCKGGWRCCRPNRFDSSRPTPLRLRSWLPPFAKCAKDGAPTVLPLPARSQAPGTRLTETGRGTCYEIRTRAGIVPRGGLAGV